MFKGGFDVFEAKKFQFYKKKDKLEKRKAIRVFCFKIFFVSKFRAEK